MDATDHELLEKWRGGDREAGDALFERHFQAIYRFFRRKVGGDVGDLVQRTFLGLAEAKDRFRGESSVRTFLYSIARHELSRHWRDRARDAPLDFGATSLHDLDPTPSQQVLDKQDDRILLEALRRIPLDLQIAIELGFWEGLSGPEVATVLDIPEGTVRSRLRRGLEMLRKHVEEIGGSGEALRSTLTNLDAWAAQVKDAVD